ncbi:hypothetical protein A9P82_05820 [Arachidicoccus ginsenosidimutans]|uniref:response regulator transcription factor n=1 Tax=Arachidicoccus sp. BS20 TaxID=1850526 RepID=UPI0007F16663|nr:response regulator transcription factor [Arachidicoccus sp. BS20]ANI88848.1 hypothetical protein A9P82_05820 [Arachidicoccus sp. BS20]
METIINVGIADDHPLVIRGLQQILSDADVFRITVTASNGKNFIEQLRSVSRLSMPDIAIIDINMPVMDGYATTRRLCELYPDMKVVALSMYNNDYTTLKMLQSGARGFVNKNAGPEELMAVLHSIAEHGCFYPAACHPSQNRNKKVKLTDKEIQFLRYCCKEMNYVEIAAAMYLSANTIYSYRDILYKKLNVKTRTGLAVYALQSGLALPSA